MSWIKRNLAFVISLAVALALLIGGAVYLFSAQSDAEAANGELEAKKNATAAKLADDVDPVARPEHAMKVFPLGMTWACLLLGLGLLIGEWIIRKRVSLP